MDLQLEPASGDIDIDNLGGSTDDDDSLSEGNTRTRLGDTNLLPLAFSMSGNTIGITSCVEHAPRAVRTRGEPESTFIEKTKRTISGREAGKRSPRWHKSTGGSGLLEGIRQSAAFCELLLSINSLVELRSMWILSLQALVEDYCGSAQANSGPQLILKHAFPRS